MENNTWEKEAQKKIIDPNAIAIFSQKLKEKKKTIATLNGSFDLLHAGHLYIIYEAAKKADVLIVALNSDASIQKYKNKNRPIIPLQFRLQLVAAVEFVDYVTWFEETDPRNLLEKIRPDIHVNGMEYQEDCIEEEVVKKYGGEMFFVDRKDKNILATSDIIKRIKTCV